jgi:heme-degrading monooxygenase HmoA
MAVRILLKRMYPEDKSDELKKLVDRLRAATTGQPGYISGETLRRVDQPGECLVISKWKTRGDWDRWFESPKRAEVQKQIDDLLGSPTTYEIYDYE